MTKNKRKGISGKLTAEEVRQIFEDEGGAGRFPPFLTLAQAAELARVPVKTVQDWRYKGLLSGCSAKGGKRVRVLRDRFLQWLFQELTGDGGRHDAIG